MTKYEPEIQKRIDRYIKKGYMECSILEGCDDCGNGMYGNQKSPIYFNENTSMMFCTKCGYRWRI